MIDGLNDESSQMSDVRVTVMEMATGKWAELNWVLSAFICSLTGISIF